MIDKSAAPMTLEALAKEHMQHRFRRATKQICKRFKVEYHDNDGSVQYFAMLCLLANRFIMESKEFNAVKRGRVKRGPSDAEVYARFADDMKKEAAAKGFEVSDKQIANFLADRRQEIEGVKFIDPATIAQQISRGRCKLRPNDE